MSEPVRMTTALGRRRVIRNWAAAVGFLVLGAAFVAGGVVIGASASADGEILVGVAFGLAAVGAGVACLLYVRTGVVIDDDGFDVRWLTRTRRFRWDQVASFGLVRRRWWRRLPEELDLPGMTLRDGTKVWIKGIHPPGRPIGLSMKPYRYRELEQLEALRRSRSVPG